MSLATTAPAPPRRPFRRHGWWLASRASGLVALVLVTISVGLGLAMAGKVMRRPGLSRKLLAIHEHTALAGLVAIAVHGITLLGDPWLHPGVAGRHRPLRDGLPAAVRRRSASSAATSRPLLGLSFYVRKRIGAKLWRKAHRATVVVYVLGLVPRVRRRHRRLGAAWFRWWVLMTAPVHRRTVRLPDVAPSRARQAERARRRGATPANARTVATATTGSPLPRTPTRRGRLRYPEPQPCEEA